MPISYVGSNVAGATGSTSITVNNPAGVATDDLIIVQGSLSRSGSTFLNASYTGWTILRDETQLVDGSTIISRIVYRFADGSATDAPPTFQTGTSGNTIATVGVYRGVDKTSPFVTDGFTIEATSQTAHTGPVLNNTVAGAWGIFFGASRQVISPQSWTATSPLVLRQTGQSGAANTNNASHLLADTNGTIATGNHTWAGATAVATQVATMWAGILRPAATGPAAPVVGAGLDSTVALGSAFLRTATETNSPTSRAWTIQSGPTGVGTTIGTAAALNWTPTLGGVYVLRYSATNAGGTGTDDVQLTVTVPTPATILNLGTGAGKNPFDLQTTFPGDADITLVPLASLVSGYTNSTVFYTTPDGQRVRMQARADAPKTANGAGARTELREMAADGLTNAAWDANTGTHEIRVKATIASLPAADPEVVVLQLHDGDSDVITVRTQLVSGTIRLRARLYGTSVTTPQLANPYVPGTEFELKLRIVDGAAGLYYNDMATPIISWPAGTITPTAGVSTFYFKAGAYNQFDATTATATDYAPVELRDLTMSHAGSSALNKLKIGNSVPTAIKIGNQTVTKVYLGSVQIWP